MQIFVYTIKHYFNHLYNYIISKTQRYVHSPPSAVRTVIGEVWGPLPIAVLADTEQL